MKQTVCDAKCKNQCAVCSASEDASKVKLEPKLLQRRGLSQVGVQP